jgi:hypothetical protein
MQNTPSCSYKVKLRLGQLLHPAFLQAQQFACRLAYCPQTDAPVRARQPPSCNSCNVSESLSDTPRALQHLDYPRLKGMHVDTG